MLDFLKKFFLILLLIFAINFTVADHINQHEIKTHRQERRDVWMSYVGGIAIASFVFIVCDTKKKDDDE